MINTLEKPPYYSLTRDISPELELIILCARTKIDSETIVQSNTLLNQKLDWVYLLQKAKNYGVLPLLYFNFNQTFSDLVPQRVLIELKLFTQINAQFNLLRTQELIDLLKFLQDNNIRAIPFKGATLASLAYQNLALRKFGDLDILVSQKDYDKAEELLVTQGYQATEKYQFKPLELAINFFSSSVNLIKNKENIYVDLHRRITSRYLFASSFDFEKLWQRSHPLSLNQISVPGFHPEDLLIYLCIHGSTHFFSKLKWICDIAELLHTQNENINWENLVDHAQQVDGERILLLGLFLAQDLLSATLPGIITHKINHDPEIPYLAEQVYQQLFAQIDNSNQTSLKGELGYYTRKFRFFLRLIKRPQDKIYLSCGYLLHYARVLLKFLIINKDK